MICIPFQALTHTRVCVHIFCAATVEHRFGGRWSALRARVRINRYSNQRTSCAIPCNLLVLADVSLNYLFAMSRGNYDGVRTDLSLCASSTTHSTHKVLHITVNTAAPWHEGARCHVQVCWCSIQPARVVATHYGTNTLACCSSIRKPAKHGCTRELPQRALLVCLCMPSYSICGLWIFGVCIVSTRA